MKQGDIYWADLEPAQGREQTGCRPVLIISGDTMNSMLDLRIICPLSSQIKNLKGCVVLRKNNLNNLKVDSEILPFQIRSVTTARLKSKIGEVTVDELEKVKNGLQEMLVY